MAKVDMKLPTIFFISIGSKINRIVTDGGAIQFLKFTTDLIRTPLL